MFTIYLKHADGSYQHLHAVETLERALEWKRALVSAAGRANNPATLDGIADHQIKVRFPQAGSAYYHA